MPNKLNQRGFAQILVAGVIVVLVAGLSVGIYLIKHRTNIEPKAEEFIQPERDITGDFISPPDTNSANTFQLPKFIAKLIPTAVPTPQPTAKPSPTSPAGAASDPIPTTVITLTPTPVPTLIPTIFPTSTLTPAASTPTTFAPTSIPAPTTVSLEGSYRVSFDPTFSTLIDTRDGGIFGTGDEKIIPITLTGNGPKYVYIQFFENGNWVPQTPVVASITVYPYFGPNISIQPTPLISPTPVIIGGKDYGDGTVYGAQPPGGFWDDNGPSGPGWYVPSTAN